MHISTKEASDRLAASSGLFLELFQHGTLSVEFYRPVLVDHQQPHERDEVYVIASGHGEFYLDGQTMAFQPGDFLFVKAGKVHYFQHFSEDFATWVFFYGPKGGEANLEF